MGFFGSQVDRVVSTERQCLHYYLGGLVRTQRYNGDLSSVLFLELDALFESVLLVGVYYKLYVGGFYGLSVRSDLDSGRCVWNPA